jgi:hypothetical protein
MGRKRGRSLLLGIKVEAELADVLNKLPNKSAFIRKAILAQLDVVPCPLCGGAGIVPAGIHAHYAPFLAAHRCSPCEGCGDLQPLPPDLGHCRPEDRPRLDQFLRGGPLYCADCYRTRPACDVCGLHLPPNVLLEHRRQAHAESL